jgi:hypothetical protein
VGEMKVDPPSEIFEKLVNKNAIKNPKKCTLPQKNFTSSIYHPLQNLAKNSWTLPPGFSNRVHL